MKATYKLILILSATALPAFAETIATDSMDEASASFAAAPAQFAPAVLPAAVPAFAQNDDLLKRALATNDPQLKKMIEDQVRLGGVQNLRNAQFRKNINARLAADTATEAESIRLRSEVSQLRSQLARLEAAVERVQVSPVNSTAPQVAPMPTALNNSNNQMSMMLMSMLASMQQQQQQSPFMNNYSQFYPQNSFMNGFAQMPNYSYANAYGQNSGWMYGNNQNFFARPAQPMAFGFNNYQTASHYRTPTYTAPTVTSVPSTLPYRL